MKRHARIVLFLMVVTSAAGQAHRMLEALMQQNASAELTTGTDASVRRNELDWLRTIVVYGLIPYHAAVIFTLGPGDYVKSSQRSLVFDVVATLVSFLGLPLLFLVAGGAAWFALGKRAPLRFMAERVARLGIPFIFGILVLVPIQLYAARSATPGYRLNYLQFYGSFLTGWANIGRRGVFGQGLQYWGHLWFILYLLAVSWGLLPLLLVLRRPSARAWLELAAAMVKRHPFVLVLGSAPLVLIEAALQGPIGPRPYADYNNLYSGAAGLVLYAVVFALGYVLYSDDRLQQALISLRVPALVLGMAALATHESILVVADATFTHTWQCALLVRCLRGFIAWTFLVTSVGYAIRYLTGSGPLLRYLNQASYPVYILHMPVLSVLGYFMIRWPIPSVVTWSALVVATAALTLALYEILMRVPPARVLLAGRLEHTSRYKEYDQQPGISVSSHKSMETPNATYDCN